MSSKKFIIACILVVFTVMFIRYYQRGPSRNYSDFRVYHATAVRFLAGENIYETADPKITPFKYSPAFALLISPLGSLPIHEASLVFFTVNFILLALLAYFSKKFIFLFCEEKPTRTAKLLLYFVPLAGVFRFGLLVLDSGQANLLMTVPALIGLYWIEKKKEVRGALLLALSVMVKYVTFIFLPYLILRKKWKAVFMTLAGMGLYSLIPALFCGWERAAGLLAQWMPFITKTSLDQGSWTDYKNQSVYSWVVRFLMTHSPYEKLQPSLAILDFRGALLAGIALSLSLYALALFSSLQKRSNPAVTYAALFCGLAIFNPNCWPFNFVVLFFPLMMLTWYLIQRRGREGVTLFCCASATILLNIGSNSVSSEKLQYVSEVWSFMTIAGVLVFLAVTRLNFCKESYR